MEMAAPVIILSYTTTHHALGRHDSHRTHSCIGKGHPVNLPPRFAMRLLLGAATLLAFALLFDAVPSPAAEETARDKEIAELKAQIKALTKRLE